MGQLEEKGFKIVLENGKMCVFDQDRTLLISAPRPANRLYLVKFGLVSPVCLLAQSKNESWLWNARFGHFRALNDLTAKQMVEVMLTDRRLENICNGCNSW